MPAARLAFVALAILLIARPAAATSLARLSTGGIGDQTPVYRRRLGRLAGELRLAGGPSTGSDIYNLR